jgi:hypothetical protein
MIHKSQARERVERLEDRILLSAQPFLLSEDPARNDSAEIIVVDHAQVQRQPVSQFDSLAGVATYIDLSQGVQQNALLTSDTLDASLLRLNDQLMFLVFDLGSGNDSAVLSSAGDDKLRLSGSSFNDIVFTRPGALLGIRGGSGVDSLKIESVDIGSGSLEVEAETIVLALGQTLIAGEDVALRASAATQQLQGSSVALDMLARVSIEGSIFANGMVTLDASVFTDVRLTPDNLLLNATINAKTAAEAEIGSQASVQSLGLSLTAHTFGHLEVVVAGVASGSVLIDASQSTRAGVRDGAALTINGRSGSDSVDLLVEAIDQSRVATSLSTSDSLISSLTGFDVGLGEIRLQRNTLAYLGEVDGQGAARLSLTGLDGAPVGRVQVSAASLDAPEGGVQGQVVSNLVGVQLNTVDDQVKALVGRADLTVSGLQVLALSKSSLDASAKVASNQATGTTQVLIADSRINTENELRLLASDLASFEAISTGLAADLALMNNISVGIAAASNTLDRVLLAGLENSTVQAGALLVVARSSATISANAQAMAVTASGLLTPGFKLAMGGSYAWNQVLGTVEASMKRSSVVAVNQGGVEVNAKNTTSVSATSVAGAAASSGAELSASLAFNAVGWDMGNIATAAISSLLGTDLGANELPLETLAFVTGSDIRSAGGVSVTAVDAIALNAVIASNVGDSSALGALSFGAAAVLSSNRVRSDSKAYIERAAGSGVVLSGGSVTVSAGDNAAIDAKVTMRSIAAANGSSMAVGGVVVRNDVRGAVTADLDGVHLVAAGDQKVEALQSARVSATLSGTVKAGVGSGFSDNKTSGGTSLAANALIATNMILSDAQAQVRGSTLTLDGNATVAARNVSTIHASNEAMTESSGIAAGVTLAFNAIGWQAQNVFAAGLNALLGGDLIGREVPASVRATVLDSSLLVGGNLLIDAAVQATVNANTSNEANSVGTSAAASMVLATNYVSSTAHAFIDEPLNSTHRIVVDGALTVTASDAPSVSATTKIVASSIGEEEYEAGYAFSRVDFTSKDGRQPIQFGSQVMLADDYEKGGIGGHLYRYMGGASKLIDLSAENYSDAGYWYEILPTEGQAGELLALVDQAKKLVNTVQDTVTQTPTASALWVSVQRTGGAAQAQSESQVLTLPAGSEAGEFFALALESGKTAPIAVLPLGVPNNELQRLTILADSQAIGQSYTLMIGAVQSSTLVFSGDATTEAASIQAAIEAWFGAGNVTVSVDTSARAGMSFDIRFMGAEAGVNQAQILASASGPVAAQLLFNSRTLTHGSMGATTADQAALIADGLNAVYGPGAVNVVWLSAAADQNSYRIDFVAAALAGRDLPALRVVDKSSAFAATVATAVQGAAARSDSFMLDRYVLTGTKTFDLEITIDGVAYLATDIADNASDAEVAAAIAAALSPQSIPLGGSGITVTAKLIATAEGARAWTITLGGDIAGHIVDDVKVRTSPVKAVSDLLQNINKPAGSPMAVGGVVVRNDVRGQALAYLLRTDVSAGSVRVEASDSAVIKAKLDSTATATGGDGAGLAAGGVIATNLVLSQAQAHITDSRVSTDAGDVVVLGKNSSHIQARNQSAMESDGASVGVTLAFNTLGWAAQNLLFAAVDALVGSNIGTEQPSGVLAHITNSDINATGNVIVKADSEAYIHADILNETSSILAAAEDDIPEFEDAKEAASGGSTAGSQAGTSGSGSTGGTGGTADPEIDGIADAMSASGLSVGFVLASNRVSSTAHAWIDGDGRSVKTLNGDLTVASTDKASIKSNVELSAVSAAGDESEVSLAAKALLNYFGLNYTDRSGEQTLQGGDRVRLADANYVQFDRPAELKAGDRVALTTSVGGGAAGQVFEYVGKNVLKGAALDTQNYRDTTLWKQVLGKAGKTYIFIGEAGQRDLGRENFSDTSRWLLVNVDKLKDLGLAVAGALGGADGSSSAFGGLVVRNDVRSDVKAWVDGQALNIAGDVSISATQSAVILAEDNSAVSADTVGINVVIATNTVLSSARAWAEDSDIVTSNGGTVSVLANNRSQIRAYIDSQVQASVSVGVVLAFNTIGYAPQNLLSNAVDALLGTEIGDQTPARTEAFTRNTRIDALGTVRVSAVWDGVIDAVIKSSAVAVSIDTATAKKGEDSSKSKLTSVTVAPVLAMNKISADVVAHIDQPVAIASGGDVLVEAIGATTVHAKVAASAVSIAAGAKGASRSVSVGLSLSRNMVRSDVDAWMLGAASKPALVSAAGDIVIESQRRASIIANGSASAVAIAASPTGGPAVAGGGTLAFNMINGDSQAYAENLSLQASSVSAGSGNVHIIAQDSSLIDARLRAVAVAVAVSGKTTPAVALGMSVARNFIGKSALAVPVTDFAASQFRGISWNFLSDEEKKSKVAVGDRVRVEQSTLALGNQAASIVVGQVFEALSARYDNRSDAGRTDLNVGERVRRVSGDNKDLVYEFLGDSQGSAQLDVDLGAEDYDNAQRWRLVGKFNEFGEIDLNTENYSDTLRWRSLGVDKSLTALETGQTVLDDTSSFGSQAYRYVGDPIKGEKGIDLAIQNYGDESSWVLMGWESTVAQTLARLTDTTVNASGEFKLDARGNANIMSTVLAGAAAVGASTAGPAVAVGAAGVYAENRISSSVSALAESSLSAPMTIVAGQATLLAQDRSSIDAIAGAAALSASLAGAGDSVSVSIGLAIAFNSIDSDVLATARGIDLRTTNGNAIVSASSAADDLFAMDWEDLRFDAAAMDEAANAGRQASRTSGQGQVWDYRSDEGATTLRADDRVMIVSSTVASSSLQAGEVYKYKGAAGTTVNLGNSNVYTSTDWERVDIAQQEMQAGYTVQVTEGHSYGGIAGRVYRYIGVEPNFSTEDEKQTLAQGDFVSVGSNHKKANTLKNNVYKYLGSQAEVELASADFSDEQLWEKVDTKENVALWKENYADTTRWVLAEDFADPQTALDLAAALTEKGLALAGVDTLNGAALYTTADGVVWNFRSDTGKQDLVKGKRVGIADTATGLTAGAPGIKAGVVGGQIYRFVGSDQKQVDLALENYKDTTRWELVTDNTRELFNGNTVRLDANYAFGGQGGRVYQFIGKNRSAVALSTEDYSNTSRWVLVQPPLRVSVVEAGLRWQVSDASGQTWQLRSLNGELTISRSSISAVVAAASMGAALSLSTTGVAVSGAGALALNDVRGSTTALIERSNVYTSGDLLVDANSSASITAVVAAVSVALGGGVQNGVAVSIGVAVARNLIGQPGYGGGEGLRSSVRALIQSSTVETAGDLVLRADAEQTIHALVLSGSAAISAAGNVGVSVDGSGVWAENLIGVQVMSGIDGEGSLVLSRVKAASLLVSAEDRAAISAVAAAASISASVAGNTGVAVSIGVALARNVIDNQVSALVRYAQADISGGVVLSAISDSSISVVSAAAAAAVAIGGSVGVGVAGAGASAVNVILGKVSAQVADSDLRVGAPVDLTSRNAARIKATIVSAALGVG